MGRAKASGVPSGRLWPARRCQAAGEVGLLGGGTSRPLQQLIGPARRWASWQPASSWRRPAAALTRTSRRLEQHQIGAVRRWLLQLIEQGFLRPRLIRGSHSSPCCCRARGNGTAAAAAASAVMPGISRSGQVWGDAPPGQQGIGGAAKTADTFPPHRATTTRGGGHLRASDRPPLARPATRRIGGHHRTATATVLAARAARAPANRAGLPSPPCRPTG